MGALARRGLGAAGGSAVAGFQRVGSAVTGLAGMILVAFIGAVILLLVLRLVMGGMGGGYRRRRLL